MGACVCWGGGTSLKYTLLQILSHSNKAPLKPQTKHKASCKPDSRGFGAMLQSSFVAYFWGQMWEEEGGGAAFGVW